MTPSGGDEISLIAVGRVTHAHGIKGEVAVLPLSQVEARFERGSRLLVEGSDRPLTVASARPHRHRLLVTFDEVSSRDEAEGLQGRYLMIAASQAPSLPEGEFWPHQLIGCRVETARSGREALAMARVGAYDAILVDIRLPDLSGYEAYRRGAGASAP